MNSESNLNEVIERFAPITLEQMDAVKLMRRTDTKFVFNVNLLPELLCMASDNYYMVEINNLREQIYQTTYFDTPDYSMYTSHHNGKLNRCKIRVRRYVCSNQEFLEVKRKNNHGETIKNRIMRPQPEEGIDVNDSKRFLEKYTPFGHQALWPKLGNKFIRLTLVNKNLTERITLDYNLEFTDLKYNKNISANGVCIAEIKKDKESKKSPFITNLSGMRIRPSGFSKYCIGLAMLKNPEIKLNLFRQKIRAIEKI
jgi:hypothetical protein